MKTSEQRLRFTPDTHRPGRACGLRPGARPRMAAPQSSVSDRRRRYASGDIAGPGPLRPVQRHARGQRLRAARLHLPQSRCGQRDVDDDRGAQPRPRHARAGRSPCASSATGSSPPTTARSFATIRTPSTPALQGHGIDRDHRVAPGHARHRAGREPRHEAQGASASAASKWFGGALQFEASFKTEDKEGSRMFGKGFACSATWVSAGSCAATAPRRSGRS